MLGGIPPASLSEGWDLTGFQCHRSDLYWARCQVTRLFHNATVSWCDHFLDATCICCLKLHQIFCEWWKHYCSWYGQGTPLSCKYTLMNSDIHACAILISLSIKKYFVRNCIAVQSEQCMICQSMLQMSFCHSRIARAVCIFLYISIITIVRYSTLTTVACILPFPSV